MNSTTDNDLAGDRLHFAGTSLGPADLMRLVGARRTVTGIR
jgi:hypothetical protein